MTCLNLLNKNLSKASLKAWQILKVQLYCNDDNALSNDLEVHTPDWKGISSKPKHWTLKVLQGVFYVMNNGVENPKQHLTNI